MASMMLSANPVYFYDQMKTRTIKRTKKIPEELPSDMKYMNINPRLANFINSINKNRKGTSTQAEKKQPPFPNEDKVQGEEKHPLLPEINSSNSPKNSVENLVQKVSQIQMDDDQFMSPFEDHKYVAPTLLHELGKLLFIFSQYEIIFPQGVVNVLNYSWKELIDGAVYIKRYWQSKKVASEISLLESESKPPGAGTAPHEKVDNAKNSKNKTNAALVDHGKEKGRQDMVQNKLPGNKSPQSFAPHLPVTISFSMSSRASESRGWIFHKTDTSSEMMEWKGLVTWALERLQLAQIQINKQLTALKEKGWSYPVILRYYNKNKKAPQVKLKKTNKSPSFSLTDGKPPIPVIKRENTSLQKLHYALIDGSTMVYYPSGHLAVCQSSSGLPCGGFYSNIFSSEQVMLGTFTPFGHGSVCFPDSKMFALQYNQIGGVMSDKEGEIVKEWQWPRKGKLSDPITLQVNENISVRIVGQFAITLIYKWQHETVRLSLSPLLEVPPPQLEDLGLLLTNEHFSSRTARELCKGIKKKGKDSKKNPKKATILSQLAKTLEIPENQISTLNDYSAATELHKIQRKVRNIVDDWMDHYRLALGIDSPHIKRMSEAPPKMSRRRKVQSAIVFPVTLSAPKPGTIKQTDTEDTSIESLLQERFRSAPAYTHMKRCDTPRSSTSPRPSSLRSLKKERTITESSLSKSVSNLPIINKSRLPTVTPGPLLSVEQNSENPWHMTCHACPVVLQNILLGQEGQMCRCSNHQVPYVTDLEYDKLINKTSCTDQITVVCVVSSLTSEENKSKDVLDELYEKMNRYRTMPCMQGRTDSFRLLKYDISSPNELTGHKNSLLVQRHNAAPGMILMYVRGKLLFANYIFNGYGRSLKDLHKQIAQTRSEYQMGYSLPNDFKFSHEGLQSYSSLNTVQAR